MENCWILKHELWFLNVRGIKSVIKYTHIDVSKWNIVLLQGHLCYFCLVMPYYLH